MSFPNFPRKWRAILLLLGGIAGLNAASPGKLQPESYVPAYRRAEPGTVGRVTRQALAPAELKAAQPVHFALKLRNFDELQARIFSGEVLTMEEMSRRYLPLPETWQGQPKGSCFTFYLLTLWRRWADWVAWRASCGWSFPGRYTT